MIDNILVNTGTVVVFFITLYISYWYITKRSLGNLPPGPPVLPIIGSLPWLSGPDIREVFRNMGVRYGDIFTVYLGGKRTVILNSSDVIKDAFLRHHEVFADRPQDLFFIAEFTKGSGIVSACGTLWKKRRTFIHNMFREFGVTSSLLEKKILEEVEPMLATLTSKDRPINPRMIIQTAVANIIGSFIWGERCEYDDPRFIRFMTVLGESIHILGHVAILAVFPQLKHVPGDLFKYHRLVEIDTHIRDDVMRRITEQMSSHQPGERRSFLDAYLEHAKSNPEEAQYYDDKQLLALLLDLYAAGAETTATTLVWSIVYMLRYPDVHKKVQAEVEQVIGSSRLPSTKDKLAMPYTEACLLEIQRMADIVPLGVPRSTTQHIQFHGYDIPKDTTIMPNLYAVHRDPVVFPEPYEFRPDRFIENGKVFGRDRIMPFSIGKRNCLGEAVARMELFLIFACMIQRLDFRLPAGDPMPEEYGLIAMSHASKPYQVIITRR